MKNKLAIKALIILVLLIMFSIALPISKSIGITQEEANEIFKSVGGTDIICNDETNSTYINLHMSGPPPTGPTFAALSFFAQKNNMFCINKGQLFLETVHFEQENAIIINKGEVSKLWKSILTPEYLTDKAKANKISYVLSEINLNDDKRTNVTKYAPQQAIWLILDSTYDIKKLIASTKDEGYKKILENGLAIYGKATAYNDFVNNNLKKNKMDININIDKAVIVGNKIENIIITYPFSSINGYTYGEIEKISLNNKIIEVKEITVTDVDGYRTSNFSITIPDGQLDADEFTIKAEFNNQYRNAFFFLLRSNDYSDERIYFIKRC